MFQPRQYSDRAPFNVLLVETGRALPAPVRESLAAGGYHVDVSTGYDKALSCAQSRVFDAIVLPAPAGGADSNSQPFRDLMRAVTVQGMAAMVLGATPHFSESDEYRLVEYASEGANQQEISLRLETMLRYHRIVRSMERDLNNMQRLFKQLNIHFNEVDQEMRLAGRLQSDFLPRTPLTYGPIAFHAVNRPATFVSGDIFDVARVDEDHVAFYIADAVGHGMAASLLTMFIKNAVVSKNVSERNYRLLSPSETLAQLNERLSGQHLPNSQFVTAFYGLVNTKTRQVQYARAGHPYPLLYSPCGQFTELKSPGGLLGLFPDEEFPTQTLTLEPGEKLILYSDGLEVAFAPAQDRKDALAYYRQVISEIAHLSGEDMVAEMTNRLDVEAGSLNPRDDISLLILEVSAA